MRAARAWLAVVVLMLLPFMAGAEPAFDPAAFKSLSGYSEQEDGWRLEYTLQRLLVVSGLEIGLVAEGRDDQADLPWGWVQYTYLDQPVAVTRLQFTIDGQDFGYTNLDIGDDPEDLYTTWSMGQASLPLFERLQTAQHATVTLYWEDNAHPYEFVGPHLAGLRQFAQAMVESDYLGALEPHLLLFADSLYHQDTVEKSPLLVGDGWQQMLEPLNGYAHDDEARAWRYEGFLYHEDQRDELMVGMVLQGEDAGNAYIPWMYLELLREGAPLYAYQVALTAGDQTFTYQKLTTEDGYMVWGLGHHGPALLKALREADSVDVKVYHPDGVDKYAFHASGLAMCRAWARTMQQLQVFESFDPSALMQLDIEHIVTMRPSGASTSPLQGNP